MMPLQNTMTKIEIPMVMHTEDTINCFADLQASSFFPAPRNWEVTTAPPVPESWGLHLQLVLLHLVQAGDDHARQGKQRNDVGQDDQVIEHVD